MLSWGGLPNLFWTFDRGKGISLFYAGNILPYRDSKSREIEELFQKEIYTRRSQTGPMLP
jgi:hypothetical protein